MRDHFESLDMGDLVGSKSVGSSLYFAKEPVPEILRVDEKVW
jgi:hypothetical protein